MYTCRRAVKTTFSDPHGGTVGGLAEWKRAGHDKRNYSTLGPVCDCIVFGWLNYLGIVTSHPGQLSLAIPPWVGAMSTSLGWEGISIGLASYWPCVTDSIFIHLRAHGL